MFVIPPYIRLALIAVGIIGGNRFVGCFRILVRILFPISRPDIIGQPYLLRNSGASGQSFTGCRLY